MEKPFQLTGKFEIPEHRREARIHVEYPTELTILSLPNGAEPAHKSISCVTTNISLSGARLAIATVDPVPVGTRVRIRVKCGLLKSFTFAGAVRNTKRDPRSPISFVGFEITSDSGRMLAAWQKFIARHFLPATQGGLLPKD